MGALAVALCLGMVPGNLAAQRPAPDSGVAVTYLANEGVLLAAGPHKVLIDAFFLRYSVYPVAPAATQSALAAARPPFDSVDLILATHRHGDHFHPEPVADHLAANPAAVFLSSRQVIDSLRAGRPNGAPPSQTMARTMAPGNRRREVVNGVTVELLGLPHGGSRHRNVVEHLGFVVELGGRRVLHVGDAELSDATLAPFRLDTEQIDVALVPYWALVTRESREAILRWVKPRAIAAFHVTEGEAEQSTRDVLAAIPDAVVFTRPLETHRW